MKTDVVKSEAVEVDRIRLAYAQRAAVKGSAYSVRNLGHLLHVQEREYELLDMFARHNVASLAAARILDVGCGTGYWIRLLLQWGAQPDNMFGIDLVDERICDARRLCPERVHLECRNATSLPYPDDSFDLVLQSTVFTSITDENMKKRVALEMLRVLKPTGFIIWYDFLFDSPRNPHVRGVGMREIRTLFPGTVIHHRRITLVPPIGRLIGGYSRLAYDMLSRAKVFCTHCLCLIGKL